MALRVAPDLLSLRPLHRREYDRLVALGSFDDERVELLAGVLSYMSPQGAAHADLAQRLASLFGNALTGRAVVRAHSPLAAGDDSEPEPDVAVVPLGDYSSEHPKTALLVVEVSDSSLRKDRTVKAPLYAAAGIADYWIVNLEACEVEVHRDPEGGQYRAVSKHGREATLHALAFPDVPVVVGELLRR